MIIRTCIIKVKDLFKNFKRHIPMVQLEPIQPATQEHNPSVFRHVLQLGKQTLEQFPP